MKLFLLVLKFLCINAQIPDRPCSDLFPDCNNQPETEAPVAVPISLPADNNEIPERPCSDLFPDCDKPPQTNDEEEVAVPIMAPEHDMYDYHSGVLPIALGLLPLTLTTLF